MMYNKNNWQYKGLVRWYRLNGKSDFIKDEISDRRLPLLNDSTMGFNNPDSTFIHPLPNGLSGKPFFSYANSSLFPGHHYWTDQQIAIDGITCSFWFNQKEDSASYYIVYYEYDNNRYPIRIDLRPSNQIGVYNSPIGGDPINFSVPYTYHKWHHCVVVLYPTQIVLFVDGVRYTAQTPARSFGRRELIYWSGLAYNYIGSPHVLLHDFRLYNYPWSDAQCLKFYNSQRERIALFTDSRIVTFTDKSLLNVGVPLYTSSTIAESSNIDAYIGGSSLITDNMSLLSLGPLSSELDRSLYIKGLEPLSGQSDLYVVGSFANNSGISQFINGYDTIGSGMSLWLSGPLPNESGVSWWLSGPLPKESGSPLYVKGHEPLLSQLDLCMIGSITDNSSISQFINGYDTIGSGMSLWLSGPLPNESGRTLYVKGHEPLSSQLDLYMVGSYINSSGISQFVHGYDTRESGISFFTKGHIPISSGITAYIYGHRVHAEGMNMYTEAAGSSKSKGLVMSMWASSPGTVGIYDSVPMMLYNTVTTDPRNGINFAIKAPNGVYSEGINFVVGNVENCLNLGTTLYIDGPEGIITSGLPMYINTPVGTTGSVPFDGGMNLFINREVNSYAASTPLYMKVPEGSTSYIPTYIKGANIITNTNPMYIAGSGLPVNHSIDTYMFTRGGG